MGGVRVRARAAALTLKPARPTQENRGRTPTVPATLGWTYGVELSTRPGPRRPRGLRNSQALHAFTWNEPRTPQGHVDLCLGTPRAPVDCASLPWRGRQLLPPALTQRYRTPCVSAYSVENPLSIFPPAGYSASDASSTSSKTQQSQCSVG